jgi:hypothetical protein
MTCPKCSSEAWDWANIGFSEAKQCTDCGEIYMMKEETLTMGQRTTFNIQYKGIWLDVDVKRGQSALDGKHWVYTQEVRHADENITPLLSALEFSQIDRIIEEELNK